jgi:hypothetical protein
MTWDMYTSGDDAGQLIRPLQYTTSEADATRVRIYLKLATPLGQWKFDVLDGIDHALMLAPDTSDEYRIAIVRDIVLNDPGVASITVGPTVTITDNLLSISVTCLTTTGQIISIGT